MTLSTIMTLSFWTNRSGQTMQTQIRLLLEEHQGPHCLLFHLYLYNKIPSGFAAYMVKIQSKMKELECSQHYYYIHIHCFFRSPRAAYSVICGGILPKSHLSLHACLHYLQEHTCDISLFRRELPIFSQFLRKSPYENFQNFLYILCFSLFGISDLPTKIQEFPSLFNHSPYLEKKISLFVFWDVSHVCPRMKKILLKIKALECSQDFSHYKSMGIFPVAQGQLTPQSMVGSGRITNLT